MVKFRNYVYLNNMEYNNIKINQLLSQNVGNVHQSAYLDNTLYFS